jgi:hypothetical protein
MYTSRSAADVSRHWILVPTLVLLVAIGTLAGQLARASDQGAKGVALPALPAKSAAVGGGIVVTSASYGMNVDSRSATGNVSADIAQACNGQSSCNYRVDYHRIGDPFPNRPKTYDVSYTCGDGQARHAFAPAEAGFGSVVSLQCAAAGGTAPATAGTVGSGSSNSPRTPATPAVQKKAATPPAGSSIKAASTVKAAPTIKPASSIKPAPPIKAGSQ